VTTKAKIEGFQMAHKHEKKENSRKVKQANKLAELKSLEKDGLLKPREVVDFARSSKTAIHEDFEWNNTKAAECHRLEQARKLIRVFVEVRQIHQMDQRVRVFTSLNDDRRIGGGYRPMVQVLSSVSLRKKLLATALTELRAFSNKYAELRELCSEIGRVIEEFEAASDTDSAPEQDQPQPTA